MNKCIPVLWQERLIDRMADNYRAYDKLIEMKREDPACTDYSLVDLIAWRKSYYAHMNGYIPDQANELAQVLKLSRSQRIRCYIDYCYRLLLSKL